MSVDPNGEGMNIHNQLLDMLQGKDKDNEKTKYEPPSAKDKDYDEDFDPDDPDYLPDEEETLDSHYRKMTDRVYNPDIDDDYEDYEIPESEKACSKFDKFFEDEELNKLALIAPKATVNVIRDFKVVEKKKLETPAEVIGIAKCRNPKCVTNHQPIRTWFATEANGDEISLKCHYCEKNTDIKHAF